MADLIRKLESEEVFLMLDGFDELQSSLREKFNADLDEFIKAYSGNSVIITSRPVDSFVSYAKFSVFKIEPLTKQQTIRLISKLSYWNEQAKSDFLRALDRNLYRTHKEFASNPLLLTIMLMTYTTFGEVPAKIHVFYAKAYETMARLHDATKGSYQRPFNTQLTPEELAKLFAEFCARTYLKERIEFTNEEFAFYMDKIINKNSVAKAKSVTSRNFLLDLTNNLCIMYREGEKYYFIHRSFQEYFAALYFAFDYDENLKKVGYFFENTAKYSSTDSTFDMLYDMIPEKIERYIFLPYLEELLKECEGLSETEGYWKFCEKSYPHAFYHQRNFDICTLRFETESFLYEKLLQVHGLRANPAIRDSRDSQDRTLKKFADDWRETYSGDTQISANSVIDLSITNENRMKVRISKTFRFDTAITDSTEDVNSEEAIRFGIHFRTNIINKLPAKFDYFHEFLQNSECPIMKAYNFVRKYYHELKFRTEKEQASDDIFND